MDCGKDYILMCEKAKEIQVLRPTIANGDWFLVKEVAKPICYIGNVLLHKDSTWLPRQDQLQEMEGIADIELLCVRFHNFCGWFTETDRAYSKQFSSTEQLWLAFVMKEKYNKIWDGKDWIEKNDI